MTNAKGRERTVEHEHETRAPLLLDEERAAQMLGNLSPRTLERWRMERRGPKYVKLGRSRSARVFYRLEDLVAFIKAHERA